jgi:hypothetical protein
MTHLAEGEIIAEGVFAGMLAAATEANPFSAPVTPAGERALGLEAYLRRVEDAVVRQRSDGTTDAAPGNAAAVCPGLAGRHPVRYQALLPGYSSGGIGGGD